MPRARAERAEARRRVSGKFPRRILPQGVPSLNEPAKLPAAGLATPSLGGAPFPFAA